MRLDVLDAIDHVAKALRKIPSQQVLRKRFEFFVKAVRVAGLRVDDHFVYVHLVVVSEGRVSRMHLVNEDTERPPVYGLLVSLIQQNFWRYVLWRSADSVCALLDHLCKAIIYQFQVSIVRDHDVLGFEVSVDDVF